jgi:hypothetical protein
MNRIGYLATLIAFVLSIPGGLVLGDTKSGLDTALPAELLGWKAQPDAGAVYNRETLYDYIDGGAELYLSYGFVRLASRTYVREGQPDVIADVFDMGTSKNAFGVFSQSREVVESTFGQGSQYTEGLLLFWKGRFYVSILASPETDETKQAVFDLARTIESAIRDEGPLPDILSILPREGLVEGSIRYFCHYIWLNSHYYVADENILHIDQTTEAVLAKYAADHGGGILLVVRYPDDAAAELAYGDFVEHYLPERAANPVGAAVQMEDGKWTGCRVGGGVVAVVFDAQSEENALRLIEMVLDSGRK